MDFVEEQSTNLVRKKLNINKLKPPILSILFILALNITFNIHAQYGIRFQNISIEHGLSQSTIFCIIQDSRGFMWFATEAGLNKYDGYKFTIYKPEKNNPNSLSNIWVYSIHEDKQGQLWVGTDDGLNRFDREKEQFTRYLHDPGNPNSLSNNRVFSIFEDKSGTLWIGTFGGLNKFNQKENQFVRYTFDPINPNSISNNYIRCINEDQAGNIWIGTYGGGLNMFDKKNKKFFHYKNDPNAPNGLSDNFILSILRDKSGTMWIGTMRGGLNKFESDTKQFLCYKNDSQNPKSLSDNWVNYIYEDRSGNLWIGTNDGGLNRFNRKKNEFVIQKSSPNDTFSLSTNRIFYIYEDQSDVLWIGTYGGGLNKFSQETNNFIIFQSNPRDPSSISHNLVRSFYEDRSSVLWIGTDGGGLNKFDRQMGQTTHYKNDPDNPKSLSSNRIFSIVRDRSRTLWIGTYGGGLNKFNHLTEECTHFKHNPDDPLSLSDNRIRTLYKGRKDILWIGTDGGGLNKFNRETEEFTRYKNDPNNPISLSNNRIFSIIEDLSGRVWIGTFGGGVNRFDPEKEEFIHYRNNPDNPNSLSNDYVVSIHMDIYGILWIGTNGGGLTRFDLVNDKFTNLTETEGLPSNVIYGILEDDTGNIWMSTNKGISKLNPQTEKFENYDVSDGLQSNEFNGGAYYKSRKGWVYFGGINGFNAFHPDRIIENPHKPPVVITAFQIFNKSIPIGKKYDGRTILKKSISETREIKLSYKNNVFSFEFAALHYVFPEKNKYAYMMEGFDREWLYSDANKRFASYTNLDPGKYIFKVKASNNDGIWNEEGTTLKVTIIPPFWRTWWFYTLGVILITVLTAGTYILRVNRLKNRKEELEKLVGERTSMLEKSNTQLAEVNKQLEKLSIVARETENAVIIMDPKGNFEWVNEGFARLYGTTQEQFVKEKGGNIVDVSSNPDIKNTIKTCIKEKKTIIYESYFVPKSGKKIWFQTTLTPILNKRGKVTNLVVVESDITNIKKAEEKISKQRDQLEKANRELNRLATMDDLTGIANHRRFIQFYDLEWRRAARTARPISLILVDVDFFKLYNDTYGHQAGDTCLKNIADTMKNLINRPGDLVARYGGEEFVIILPETDSQGASLIAENLRSNVEKLKMAHKKSIVSKHVTISLGCATVVPDQKSNSSILIKAADEALYRSKTGGRNRTSIATPSMPKP